MPEPRHRSFVKRIGLCILLGLLTTLVISWTIALSAALHGLTSTGNTPRRGAVFLRSTHDDGLLVFGEFQSFTRLGATLTILRHRIATNTTTSPRGDAPNETESHLIQRELATFDDAQARNYERTTTATLAVGWPWECLRCTLVNPTRDSIQNNTTYDAGPGGIGLWKGAVPQGTSLSNLHVPPGVLPFIPIVPALLSNIAILTTPWLILIIALPRVMRFWRRRGHARLGQCAQCGYDRDGLSPQAICPECGTPGHLSDQSLARTRPISLMRKRRYAVRTAACLAFGLAMTILIAWACALAIMLQPPTGFALGRFIPSNRQLESIDQWGASRCYFIAFEEGVVRVHQGAVKSLQPWEAIIVRSQRASPPSTQPDPVPILAGGWPYRCLWASHDHLNPDSGTTPPQYRFDQGAIFLWPRSATTEPGVVPYYPIWPNLLANTVIWASPALLLVVIIPASRSLVRRVRRGRHRCPICASKRGSLPEEAPCPRCGCLPNASVSITQPS